MSDFETAANKDDSLFFHPVRHEVLTDCRVDFELYGSQIYRLTDAHSDGEPVIIFEYVDEDLHEPGKVVLLKSSLTVAALIVLLNNGVPNAVYSTVRDWGLKHFYP